MSFLPTRYCFFILMNNYLSTHWSKHEFHSKIQVLVVDHIFSFSSVPLPYFIIPRFPCPQQSQYLFQLSANHKYCFWRHAFFAKIVNPFQNHWSPLEILITLLWNNWRQREGSYRQSDGFSQLSNEWECLRNRLWLELIGLGYNLGPYLQHVTLTRVPVECFGMDALPHRIGRISIPQILLILTKADFGFSQNWRHGRPEMDLAWWKSLFDIVLVVNSLCAYYERTNYSPNRRCGGSNDSLPSTLEPLHSTPFINGALSRVWRCGKRYLTPIGRDQTRERHGDWMLL